MELITERIPLGELDEAKADALAQERDCKPSELEFVRKGLIVKAETDDPERATIELISTAAVDRDREILLPRGADLKAYMSNPQVLWAHNYYEPPIGRAAWVKRKSEGLLAKTVYAATTFAEEVWGLIKDGFLPGRSVGFIPLESHEPDDKEVRKFPDRANARRVIDKWELLEYSVVPVPSNREALQQAMAKGMGLSAGLQEQLGIEKAPENEDGQMLAEELEELDKNERFVQVHREVKNTGRFVRDTGRRVIVLETPDKTLDAKSEIEYMVQTELRRKRGRIT
tara:strand:+ start:63 stop:914 length:852 start_codon:yes stop_codon:yes gene_type:complete